MKWKLQKNINKKIQIEIKWKTIKSTNKKQIQHENNNEKWNKEK